MPKSRKQIWLTVIAVPPLLIGVFVVGLFVFMNATARPLHPDPKGVPSVTQWSPSAHWSGAVEQGRQLVRTSLVERNLPGLSVAVGAGGEIVWAEGFGWADLTQGAVAPVRLGPEVSMALVGRGRLLLRRA